jgi:GAF domain-containing protein
MPFDPAHRMVPEEDPASIELRDKRLRTIGVTDRPQPELDAIADRLRVVTGTSYAMVNFVIGGRQYSAGLSTPAGPPAPGSGRKPGRERDLDEGFCPHVLSRGTALPLADIWAYPRFAGNRVVDELGVRTYLGAPVKDPDPGSGVALGTVCVLGPDPIAWTKQDVDNVKGIAEQVTAVLRGLEGRAGA